MTALEAIATAEELLKLDKYQVASRLLHIEHDGFKQGMAEMKKISLEVRSHAGQEE